MHRTQGDRPVEDVAEQFDDGPVRAMADQHQAQDQLPQPSLGYRQVEEDFVGLGFGGKGVGQSILGGVGLLIEELAADLMFPGQIRDGLSPREDLDSQLLPLLG